MQNTATATRPLPTVAHVMTNRYPGDCWHCHQRVAAGAGTAARTTGRDWIVYHLPGECPAPAAAAPPAAAPRAPLPDVPAGRYAIYDASGSLMFYEVDRPTEGRWAGFTFVSRFASDNRLKIRDRDERATILEAIAADPVAALVRYGRHSEVCGACGRGLTVELSRKAGIGPTCAAARGIDREALVASATNPFAQLSLAD